MGTSAIAPTVVAPQSLVPSTEQLSQDKIPQRGDNYIQILLSTCRPLWPVHAELTLELLCLIRSVYTTQVIFVAACSIKQGARRKNAAHTYSSGKEGTQKHRSQTCT